MKPEPSQLQIGAIVLMAGLSRRMPNQNKLLLEIDGRPVASKTVENLISAGYSPILVVTGHEAEKIKSALQDFAISFIHNEAYKEGMGSSISKAMKATQGWDGALIAMGDMPFVSVEILQQIREVFQENPDSIVAPINGERRGQPVLFAAQFFADLALCSGDIGGRNIIKKNRGLLRLVETNKKNIFWDVDTLEDMVKYWKDTRHE